MSKLNIGRISKVGSASTKLNRVSLGTVIKSISKKMVSTLDRIYSWEDAIDAEYVVLEPAKQKSYRR